MFAGDQLSSPIHQTQYLRETRMEILNRRRPHSYGPVRLLFMGIVITLAGNVFGQSVEEYALKAAFLYNFTKFVEWPPASMAGKTFTIGIFGDDPFGHVIDDVTRGKTVSGREIRIRRLKEPAEARECNIVFVSSTDRKKIQELLDATNGPAVLTVGENREFLIQGGIIHFSIEANHVGIVINKAAAAARGLTVSAKLLSLAKIYDKATEK